MFSSQIFRSSFPNRSDRVFDNFLLRCTTFISPRRAALNPTSVSGDRASGNDEHFSVLSPVFLKILPTSFENICASYGTDCLHSSWNHCDKSLITISWSRIPLSRTLLASVSVSHDFECLPSRWKLGGKTGDHEANHLVTSQPTQNFRNLL